MEMGLKGYTFGSSGRSYTRYVKHTIGLDTTRWPIAKIDGINKKILFGKIIPPMTPEYQSNGKKVYNMDRFRFI